MKIHITGKSVPEIGRWSICGLLIVSSGPSEMIGRIHITKGELNTGKAPLVTCQRCRKIYRLT